MTVYIALLRKEMDSDFGVDFPDFPGCITAGSTLEEAREMAQEALTAHLALMAEDGEFIPAPSNLDQVMSDPDNRDAIAFLVAVPEPTSRAIRVNITIQEEVLRKIDSFVASNGGSRSSFLAKAALAMIMDTQAHISPATASGRNATHRERTNSRR